MESKDVYEPKSGSTRRYYYPSEREDSCFGKGPFKARFPSMEEVDKKCFCTIFCAFLCERIKGDSKNIPEDPVELERLLPLTVPRFTSQEDKITYTWLGHSTAVISIGTQVNIMIDPVFSRRASPFQWIGPQRYRPIACQPKNLPPIHGVFVSHDHYDHLDEQALNDLEALYEPTFFAGLDSKETFPKGCTLEQFDWTQSKKIALNGHIFEVTFVPVCHWSKRWLFDKNTRLWGGFVIKTPKGKKIFYSGDTAYCDIFKQLGEIFNGFDLCILPIGAYQPRHLLSYAHVNPEEAVILHKQLRSKKSVGVHWGTFPLGFQHYYQPKQDLEAAVLKHGLKKDEFITVGHGEQFSIDYS